jgi:hypothetical protein
MVYSNQFVAVITCRGKILRESRQGSEDVIRIPFGEEYNIRLKNLSSLRAAVDVSVDGVDALNGSRLVLAANETHDLEGFMDGSVVKNCFKFIKKTEQIADYRGDRIDDGIIQIKYQFEKAPKTYYVPPIKWNDYWDHWRKKDTYWNDCTGFEDKVYGSILRSGPSGSSCGSFSQGEQKTNGHKMNLLCDDSLMSRNLDNPMSNEGITVKGSSTNVNYSTTYLGELYTDIGTIVFKLVGETRNRTRIIKTPITVRTKLVCPTCGTKNTSRNKYCSNCGTCLE